jgi:uroporphyrinogen-III decarboxylase
MAEARQALGPELVLLGNIDPVRILRDGTPEVVTSALRLCCDAAAPRYIIGAGCEIPRGTPHENVHALRAFSSPA